MVVSLEGIVMVGRAVSEVPPTMRLGGERDMTPPGSVMGMLDEATKKSVKVRLL